MADDLSCGMRNLKIILEYDGSGYHGWQRQKQLRTVQQVLEESITRITGERTAVHGSGRTDTGVHALNQSAHFKTNTSIGAANLLAALNSCLPPDIVIKEVQEVPASFHARFDVQSKTYMYQIFNGPIRPVLYRPYTWHLRAPLDLCLMEKGLSLLVGCHDFSAFCGKKQDGVNCVRTIKDARLERKNSDIIRIYLEADGFLRYMVRSIVGTLAEIGKGKKPPEALIDILEAKDRNTAGATAPPQGLFLLNVKY